MSTISAGSSATVELDAFASITLVVTGKATLAFTSGAHDLQEDFTVTNASSRTYGPYGVPMSVVLTAVDQTLTYTVNGNTSALDYSPTWNDVAITFTGFKLNVTDTASAAASLLMDLQVGGVSKAKIDKSGNQTLQGSLTLVDAVLTRDAANTLAQRNGTAAQSFRLYNTFTDASNYERLELLWAGNLATFLTAAAGTGVARQFRFSPGGTGAWDILTTTHLVPVTSGVTDIGTGTNGVRKLHIDFTNTATVGAVTINKAAGRVRIAAAGTSVVVTNSLVTANSEIFCTIATNDATAVLKNVVASAGSFTITLNAAATAETAISFFVVSTD